MKDPLDHVTTELPLPPTPGVKAMTNPQILCVCCAKHPVPWHQLLCDCCQRIGEQLGLITPPEAPPRTQIGPLDV